MCDKQAPSDKQSKAGQEGHTRRFAPEFIDSVWSVQVCIVILVSYLYDDRT